VMRLLSRRSRTGALKLASALSALAASSALTACTSSAKPARVILPPGASFGAVTTAWPLTG
jgi:hypothetical protein